MPCGKLRAIDSSDSDTDALQDFLTDVFGPAGVFKPAGLKADNRTRHSLTIDRLNARFCVRNMTEQY